MRSQGFLINHHTQKPCEIETKSDLTLHVFGPYFNGFKPDIVVFRPEINCLILASDLFEYGLITLSRFLLR